LCVLVLAPSLAIGSSPACSGVESNGAWASIETPVVVSAFAVTSGTPERLVVSDGRSVYGSVDEGCSWRSMFSLPGTPSVEFPFVAERITTIAAPSSSVIYLAISGPHFVVSRDGGETWATSDSGLAGRGEPTELVVADTNPQAAYMTVQTTVSDEALNNGVTVSTGATATATSLWRTADGGRSWSLAAPPSGAAYGPRGSRTSKGLGPGSTWDVDVAADDPARLWAATTEGIFTSGDGGSSWDASLTDDGVASGMDVRAVTIASDGVMAIDPASGAFYTTPADDGSAPWTSRKFVGLQTTYSDYAVIKSVWLASGLRGPILATGPKGAFTYSAGSGWSDVSPVGLGSGVATLVDVAAAPGDEQFYARQKNLGTQLMRFTPSSSVGRGGGGRPGSNPVGSIDALSQLSGELGRLEAPGPARLMPEGITIRLAPGASTTKTYRLALPPHPSPIDVYFLLDSTQSMENVIRSLARSVATIATELRRDGVDVWTGLGEFRTYPYPGEESYNFPYRRDVDISPPGARLARALLAIEGDGQSGANLTALFQSAAGTGQDFVPGPSGGDIPSGANAHFRDGALRVIVHAADSQFGTPERGDPEGTKYPGGAWPGPGFDETIAALNDAGIAQVGAAIGYEARHRPADGRPNAWTDLEQVAAGTNTVAPPAGADCNGDERADVPAGEPLVCPVPNGGALLAPAIVSLIEGVRDVAPVRLEESTESGVVDGIDPSTYPAVDMRAPHSLEFQVTYSCNPADEGRTVAVGLAALLDDAEVERVRARVECLAARRRHALVFRSEPDLRSTVVAPLLPPQMPPPPPNPGPAPASAPQAQPQPNPNPNPNPQPQPAAVAQRQQQAQQVFVHAVQEVKQQAGMEYAMSSLESRPDPLATARFALGAGALSLILLYGYATVAARAIRVQRNFGRRA
jgi:hypothetical protein